MLPLPEKMEGQRIILTLPNPALVNTLYQMIEANRAYLSRFMPWVQYVGDKAQFIAYHQQEIATFHQWDNPSRYDLLRKSDGALLGSLGVTLHQPAIPSFEIGYWLDQQASGLGYMTEAVNLMTEYLFVAYQAKRVEIRMAASNKASRGVAERSGYGLEAILANQRVLPDGRIDDTSIYARHT